jgi:hypothetical protein
MTMAGRMFYGFPGPTAKPFSKNDAATQNVPNVTFRMRLFAVRGYFLHQQTANNNAGELLSIPENGGL